MASHNNQAAQQAILASLIYSDIFDFPLTKAELWQYLLSKTKISHQQFRIALEEISCHSSGLSAYGWNPGDINNPSLKKNQHIFLKNGYFCLKGREKIIHLRQNHRQEVRKKTTIAQKAAYYLSYIPSIQLIGISGGLAVGNVDETDDIDFFIITQKGTLWTTRLCILALLELMKLRRKRTDQTVANKICCNLLIEETKVLWPKDKQNIYAAHEIMQLKPLVDKKNAYHRFIQANTWTFKYFPNFNPETAENLRIQTLRSYYSLLLLQRMINIGPIKKIIKIVQEKYMQKHQTNETIKKDFLALHPHDYAVETIQIFNKKLKDYGLLTNI